MDKFTEYGIRVFKAILIIRGYLQFRLRRTKYKGGIITK